MTSIWVWLVDLTSPVVRGMPCIRVVWIFTGVLKGGKRFVSNPQKTPWDTFARQMERNRSDDMRCVLEGRIQAAW